MTDGTNDLFDEIVAEVLRDCPQVALTVCGCHESQQFWEELERRVPNYFPADGNSQTLWEAPPSGVAGGRCPDATVCVIYEAIITATGTPADTTVLAINDFWGWPVVSCSAVDMGTCLPILLGMPAHMFVAPDDFRWCLGFRMTGDIGFRLSAPGLLDLPMARRHGPTARRRSSAKPMSGGG